MTACGHKWYEGENSRNKREGLLLSHGRPLRRGLRAGALKQAKAGLAELGEEASELKGSVCKGPGARMDLRVQGWKEEHYGWGLVRDKSVVRVKARKAGRDLTVRTWSLLWILS